MIVGIDPGSSGAIAVLFRDRSINFVVDMPHHNGIVSAAGVADELKGLAAMKSEMMRCTAYVEDVHSMPKQGVASSFKFGQAHGTVLGVLGALRIPTHMVTPAKWKKALGLSSDKAQSRRRAIELWPEHSALFARVKDDGRAEAALIALYGHQITNNSTGASQP